jgi:bifunctional ADP-heptose synthase (sugar kinase/adenylyltransferase)
MIISSFLRMLAEEQSAFTQEKERMKEHERQLERMIEEERRVLEEERKRLKEYEKKLQQEHEALLEGNIRSQLTVQNSINS